MDLNEATDRNVPDSLAWTSSTAGVVAEVQRRLGCIDAQVAGLAEWVSDVRDVIKHELEEGDPTRADLKAVEDLCHELCKGLAKRRKLPATDRCPGYGNAATDAPTVAPGSAAGPNSPGAVIEQQLRIVAQVRPIAKRLFDAARQLGWDLGDLTGNEPVMCGNFMLQHADGALEEFDHDDLDYPAREAKESLDTCAMTLLLARRAVDPGFEVAISNDGSLRDKGTSRASGKTTTMKAVAG